MSQVKVSSFYRFSPIANKELSQLKERLEEMASKHQVLGLVIMGEEGINTTFSGSETSIEEMKKFFESLSGFDDLSFKDSYVSVDPFRRFKIQIRKEIVTLNRPDIMPDEKDPSHLSAKQWNEILKSQEDYVVVDTRNWYETEIGKFKNAITPDISEFTEFPKWLEKNQIPKDKKLLIYCTGGIRCEKAKIDMEEKGYKNVFQLKDGILKYLEEFPNQEYEGECFVFDHRVAVNQNLEPTKDFDLCPHCGQPAKEELQCVKCDTFAKVCHRCQEKRGRYLTCSKNCAHHFDLNPDKKIRPHTNSISSYREKKKASLDNKA